MADHDFYAWVTDPEAAGVWQKILGRTDYIPIRSPIPILADLPGLGETRVYLLQLDLLTAEERARLIDHLSERFGVDKVEASAVLDEQGLPIRASTCGVTVLNPQRWL
jgi:hypothetical protein